MSENNKHIKPYTAADIQRYLNREMTMAERHAIEKAALEDAFLAEAIEGYATQNAPGLSSDIENLRKRLQKKNDTKIIPVRNRRIWWSSAAAVIIVLGAGITWYWLAPTENNIAQQKEKEQKTTPLKETQDTAEMRAATDSTDIALQENKVSKKNVPAVSAPEKKAPVPLPVPSTKTKQPPASRAATKKDVSENPSLDIAAANKEASTKTYRIEQEESQRDKNISESRERPLPSTIQNNTSAFFNTNIFTGKITDSNNNPLPFVNIRIVNTASAVYSDARGNFKLMSGDTLLTAHVKSAGFKPRQVVLHASAPFNNIILLPEENALAEVAVTGYKTAKKKAVITDEDTDATPEAEPADGWGNFDIYLVNNTRLPGTAPNSSRGFVDLSFTVDKYGRLSDFKIMHSTCVQCNKEAIRVIKEGPQWKLSEGNIPAKVSLTIQF